MTLKRKIFGLFSILICLFAVLGLTSCGGGSNNNQSNNNSNNNNSNNNNNQSVEPSPEPLPETAYDKLTAIEKELFDYFVTYQLPYFKDPTSASFVSAGVMCENKIAKYTVSGTNSFGGKVSTEYLVTIERINDTSKYLNVDSSMLKNYDSSIEKYFGGDLESVLDASNDDFSSTFVRIYFQTKSNLTTLSIANLNKALKEYKESQGW